MNKYLSRVTSSQRGEDFNPLSWPFLLATLAYGVGFVIMQFTGVVGESSLFNAMASIFVGLPLIWGIACILTIILGATFLMFNIPPFGKISGLVGFMLWTFAAFCYLLTGNILTLLAVTVPNMWFWIWQYLSLSLFRQEDALDVATMARYNEGGYDNIDPNINSRQARLDNRGVDEQ